MPIPTLAEKLAWLKPAPATPYEKQCAAKIAQGDYEIGVQVTNDILDEAMEEFVRASRSYFGVSGDSMVALFTAGGDLINASCGTYLHAIIQPIVIKFILKYYEKNPGIAMEISGTPTMLSTAAFTIQIKWRSCPFFIKGSFWDGGLLRCTPRKPAPLNPAACR